MTQFMLVLVLSCGLLAVGVVPMSSEDMELQKQLLESIFDTVKDRQPSKGGELNLMTNESAGFATSVRSFCEKGSPTVNNGDRISMFNLSKLSDPASTQVLMHLAVRVPRLNYFNAVRYLHLNLVNRHGDPQPLGGLIVTEEEKANEWLNITMKCDSCLWSQLEGIEIALQLRDIHHNHITFTEETAMDMKSFLILYSQKSLFPLDPSQRQKRQEQETLAYGSPSPIEAILANRTTLRQLNENNVDCSRQEVLLTQEEILYRHTILAPYPGAIKFSYCYGECTIKPGLPSNNTDEAQIDRRTRLMTYIMRHLSDEPNNIPPRCVPHDMNSTMLLIAGEEIVGLGTFPNVINCKCQL